MNRYFKNLFKCFVFATIAFFMWPVVVIAILMDGVLGNEKLTVEAKFKE